MKKLLLMVAAVALLGVAPAAAATFTLDSYSIDALATDPGLVIKTQKVAGEPTSSGDLNVGDTWTFDLFKIWTNEGSVEPDDWGQKPIEVGMTFSQPGNGNGTVAGFTGGVNLGLWQWGYVDWTAPALVAFGQTGLFSVWLDDATFNQGWFGLEDGKKYGATIKANVKYLQADTPAAVPEPASMMLLGSGLAAAAAYRRRRAQKANQA